RHGSIPIDTLAAGAVFGHESLLSDQPFPYSAYATTDCTALLLSRAAFEDWLSSRPALRRDVRESASRFERRTFLGGSMLATVLDTGAIESAAAAMRERRLAPGESLVTEGRAATDLYVVRAGRLRVTQGGGDALAWVETGDVV